MQRTGLMLAVSLLAGVCVTGVLAHQDDAASQQPPQGEQLGTVLFQTSCTPEAQKHFERALAMLHSFYFPETVKAFNAIPETDPSCAIAYWGIAISHAAEPARRAVGRRDAQARARRGRKRQSDRRQDRARARLARRIEGFYKDFDKVDQDTRTQELREGDGSAREEISR